jgi:hypothetical protein
MEEKNELVLKISAKGQKVLSKNQTEDIRETILELCNDAFNSIEPNEEQEALYDKWSETSYKEELE